MLLIIAYLDNIRNIFLRLFCRKYFDIQIVGNSPISSYKGFADYSVFGGVSAKKFKIIFRLFLKNIFMQMTDMQIKKDK